jgi:L-alanine-DL-glutamate epimerase-like enolase superfamily enzyme
MTDENGRTGWGEGHISPGSGNETRAGGWAFCRTQSARIVGNSTEDAKARIGAGLESSRVAATAMLTALEMLEDHPLLRLDRELRLPLVTPVNGLTPEEIESEVERGLGQGFGTFKVKVGRDVEADLARVRTVQSARDVEADLARVRTVQSAIAGRAVIRLDANRAFDRVDGCRFAASLDPDGIELFEQPCAEQDWDANAAVAEASAVPLMLDEAICDISDVERAAAIPGIGFCKLKLKRFGGLDRLKAALDRVRELGMEPVLGDGLSSELGCWMEACIARVTIRNAGEFNGYLKPKDRLFAEPLAFEQGRLVLNAGFRPRIDPVTLANHTVTMDCFAAPAAAARGGAR